MANVAFSEFIAGVRELVSAHLSGLTLPLAEVEADLGQLLGGKMLRTRLGARLASSGEVDVDIASLERLCAATEMAHTASLCHDDVIDNGVVRRGWPALWRLTSPSGAVLLGDMLLCEAMSMVIDTDGGRYIKLFVEKTREVCATEAEQELLLRHRALDRATCERIARGKTGPLFALVCMVAGGADGGLSKALEEAGYRIGTAYQLADDLLDQVGDEEDAGKTLGTDRERGKFTLAQLSLQGRRLLGKRVGELCESALSCLAGWPGVAKAVSEFFSGDLQSVFRRFSPDLDVKARQMS